MLQDASQGQGDAHGGQEGDHGHAETVVINASPFEVTAKQLSYEQIVSYAY